MTNPETGAAREKIYKRLRDLKALAENQGATPAERLNAFSRLQSLLEKYSLTTDDIEEKENVMSNFITFNPLRYNEWLNIFCSFVCGFYNCKTLIHSHQTTDGIKVTSGFYVVGEKVDVEIATSVIEILIEQMFDVADVLYTWAQKNYVEPATSRYSDTDIINFGNFFNMRLIATDNMAAYNMHEILRKLPGMPLQTSKTWAQIEQSWGFGVSGAVINKIIEVNNLAETENEDSDLDDAMMLGVQAVALRTSIQAIREDKARNIDLYLAKNFDDIKNAPVGDAPTVEHQFLFDRGRHDATSIKIEETKKPTKKGQ